MSKERIYGLDAMRALLLIGGPLVHAADVTQKIRPIATIVHTSTTFRMAAFFMISGFIVASLKSARQWDWLMVRGRQLIVPIISITFIMMLFNIWHDLTHPVAYDKSGLYPFHLWFLMALALMTPITIFLDTAKLMPRIADFVGRHPAMLLLVAVGLSIVMRVANAMYWKVNDMNPSVWGLLLLIQTPKFAVYYLTGFFVARSEAARNFFNTPLFISFGITLFVSSIVYFYWNYDFISSPNYPKSAGYALNVLEEVVSVVAGLTVVLLGLRMKKVPKGLIELSKMSYTVYLFHAPVILFTNGLLFLGHVKMSHYGHFAFVASVSFAVSVLIHQVIKTSPLAMFLFNGRPLKTEVTKTSVAVA